MPVRNRCILSWWRFSNCELTTHTHHQSELKKLFQRKGQLPLSSTFRLFLQTNLDQQYLNQKVTVYAARLPTSQRMETLTGRLNFSQKFTSVDSFCRLVPLPPL